MNDDRDERLAGALWDSIERVRQNQDPPNPQHYELSDANAEELAALQEMAADLHATLAGPEPAAPADARVRAAMDQRAARVAAARSSEPRRPVTVSWSRWWLSAAAAAGLAVGLMVGLRIAPGEGVDHPPAAVRALGHGDTISRVPRMLEGRLPSKETRAVLWHLSHCDACFEEYQDELSARNRAGALDPHWIARGKPLSDSFPARP
jgi:anti-sigma factor RsiW